MSIYYSKPLPRSRFCLPREYIKKASYCTGKHSLHPASSNYGFNVSPYRNGAKELQINIATA